VLHGNTAVALDAYRCVTSTTLCACDGTALESKDHAHINDNRSLRGGDALKCMEVFPADVKYK
jgi:hypothetical protein